jgi:hypothetical protein
MAYNRNRRKNREENHKKIIIRCKHHSKPVFETDTCSNIKLKSKANTTKECKNCQYSY